MIEVNVVFQNSMIIINGFEIIQDNDFCEWDVYKNDQIIESFTYMEDAVKWCMEQK